MYILTQNKDMIVDSESFVSICCTETGEIRGILVTDDIITLGVYEDYSRGQEILEDMFNAIIRFENIGILQGCSEELMTGLTILSKEQQLYNRYFMPEE